MATSLLLDGAPWIVAAILCVVAVLSAVCTYLATETFRSDVSEMEEELRTQRETPASSTV